MPQASRHGPTLAGSDNGADSSSAAPACRAARLLLATGDGLARPFPLPPCPDVLPVSERGVLLLTAVQRVRRRRPTRRPVPLHAVAVGLGPTCRVNMAVTGIRPGRVPADFFKLFLLTVYPLLYTLCLAVA